MTPKYLALGLFLFIVTTSLFTFGIYKFSLLNNDKTEESITDEISVQQEEIAPNGQLETPETNKIDEKPEVKKQTISIPSQAAPTPTQASLPETITVEEELADLACQTQNKDNYLLSTSGNHAYAYYVPSNENPHSLEWDIEVKEIPSEDSYWFFAFNFTMLGTFRPEQPQVGGYAGFQIDGGKHLAIFSVWGADASEGNGSFASAEIYEDGSVNRILGTYPWKLNKTYRFKLEKDTDSLILYIDGNKIGTHHVPSDYPEDFYKPVSLFVEWFGATAANFPVCVSFMNFNPAPSSIYPGTSVQQNPLKLNIETFGGEAMFSR